MMKVTTPHTVISLSSGKTRCGYPGFSARNVTRPFGSTCKRFTVYSPSTIATTMRPGSGVIPRSTMRSDPSGMTGSIDRPAALQK